MSALHRLVLFLVEAYDFSKLAGHMRVKGRLSYFDRESCIARRQRLRGSPKGTIASTAGLVGVAATWSRIKHKV